MFHVHINRRRRQLLVRVAGRLMPSEIVALQAFGQKIAESEGPLDLILDFTGVTEIDMPVQYIAEQGEKAPVWPGRERIFVAPQPVVHALMRLFAGYQELHGRRRPIIVGRLDEALERLGTTVEDFEPMDSDGQSQALTSLAPFAIEGR
jgi:hypothetical protein